MRTALVTGSAGFVGRHMVPALEARGYDVQGCDLKTGEDCRDRFLGDNTRYDLVVHLAAIVGGRACIEGEPLKVATDLGIDADMFQWAARTKQPRVVYYSSSAAYPTALQEIGPRFLTETDIDLDDVRSPDLSYGWSKLSGEQLARWAAAEGVITHVFRPFSGYGQDQDLTYPFPSFIDRARRHADPFEIWGDGTQVRDWIHIDDVVEATLTAVEADMRGPVNLGTGRATSFVELAGLVTAAAGYTPEFEFRLDAPRGVTFRACDPTLMHSFYVPRITLEQGIHDALETR